MILIFEQVAALWKEAKRPYVKQSTYSVYLQLCNTYLLSRFGRGAQPDEDEVHAFVDRMLEDGYALKTV